MSISKLRGKSVLGHNENATNKTATQTPTPTNTTTVPTTTTPTILTNVLGTGGTTTITTATTTLTASSAAAAAAVVTTVTSTANGGCGGGGAAAAGTVPANQQFQPTQQQYLLPQTALLKIEPFVPSFNTRLRRPITRSYSTLSTTFLKRNPINGPTLVAPTIVGASLIDGIPTKSRQYYANVQASTLSTNNIQSNGGHARRQPVKVLSRQRSKSTSSSASNRPATVNENHTTNAVATTNTTNAPNTVVNTNGCIVIPQPNGICRITRLIKEQEKLPDRINYDRRGLTAIPIFEHEPNLRLLSLQHNLINVFHIPKENEATPLIANAANNNNSIGDGNYQHIVTENQTTNQHLLSPSSGYTNGGRLNRAQLKVGHTISRYALNVGTQSQQATLGLGIGMNGNTTVANNLLSHRSTLLQRNLNYNNATQQQQKSPPTSQYRMGMKKSKSFVTNYSRYLNNAKRNVQKRPLPIGQINTTDPKLKSFDSTSLSGITTDSNSNGVPANGTECKNSSQNDDEAHLEIKNKQLSTSYGIIFQNLVFLDLYDNQIERISNLDGLPTLSVLLLGKNRITDITGLASLKETLRVLDLHGNKITSISNKINCLQELKSLNLAGNQIRQINQNDFNGLLNLKELNLKRNKIRRINGFQHLIALERLWLCHNDLHKVDDMSSIGKAINLIEVTIENNPVSLAGDCVSYLVSYLPRLQSLSQMTVTDQVRRAAMAWRKNKELSDANYTNLTSDVFNNIRREEVISNARTNWELLRSQQNVQNAFRGKHRISPKHCELDKINESNEAILSYDDELQDIIKLPPIKKQPTLEAGHKNAKLIDNNKDDGQRSGSSGSSLGPNVDSSSSCFSSDNEESSKSVEIVEPTQRRKFPKTITMRGHGIETKNNSLSVSKVKDIQEKDESNKTTITTTTTTTTLATTDTSKNVQQDLKKCIAIVENTTMNEVNPLATNHMNTTDNQCTKNLVGNLNEHKDITENIIKENNESLKRNYNLEGTIQSETTQLQKNIPIVDAIIGENLTTTTTTHTTTTTASSSTTTTATTSHSTAIVSTTVTNTTSTMNSVSNAATRQQQTAAKRYTHSTLIKSHTTLGGTVNTNVTSRALSTRLNNNLQVIAQQNASWNAMNATNSTNSNVGSTNSNISLTNGVIMNGNNNRTNGLTVTGGAANVITNVNSSATSVTTNKSTNNDREREQGGDYLIEICGRYLNIYGQGALRFIDKQWNTTKANDVHTLNFSYINFNNIATMLGRVKTRFPRAEHFVFRETNINCLGQINALAELQGITTLNIDPEGNAITTKDLWRQYIIYRLSHWGLISINGVDISHSELEESNEMYGGLSDLVLWSMPEIMLQPLLTRLRLEESCNASKLSPKEWLMKDENQALRLVVGKEALQWKKPNNTNGTNGNNNGNVNQQCDNNGNAGLSARERGKIHFAAMMENTCNAIEKLQKLESLWPSLLLDIIRNTLLDYSQLDTYVRNLMNEVMKQ